MKMATDSSMLLYFAYFLHRTLVPKANSFLSSAAEHVIPGCSPYPFRHYLSRLTEIIPPLIPYPVRAYALFLPTSKKSVQAQFFVSKKNAAAYKGEKIKAQGVVRPALVLSRASICGRGAAASIPEHRKSVR
jgi:hypothetical protein